MSFSFLFDYNILISAFFGKQDEVTLASKECVNKVFRLCKIHENCCQIFSPSQAVDKLKQGFTTINSKSKFEEIFKRQGATQGVAGYEPENLITLKESGKALSFYGKVIIISNEKDSINPQVKFMTPSEFIFAYEKAKSLLPIFKGADDLDLVDLIILIVFYKDTFEKAAPAKNN